MITKWKFYKFKNLIIFAVLPRDVPMGSKDVVFSKPLLKTGTVNCLTFEEITALPYIDNFCLFCAFALDMHENHRLEEKTSNIFHAFITTLNGVGPNQFKRVHMNNVPVVEDGQTLKILFYDIDFVDGNIFRELARRSVQKQETTVQLLSYNNHICYMISVKAVFQSFPCLNCDTFSTEFSTSSDI